MSERLDVAMVAKGLAQSREKARALIMAGVVYVEGARADKAGMPVGDAVSIEVRENQGVLQVRPLPRCLDRHRHTPQALIA